jgi:hypothetical protein
MYIRSLGPDIVVPIQSVGKGPKRDDFMIQLMCACVRACVRFCFYFLFSTREMGTNLPKEKDNRLGQR